MKKEMKEGGKLIYDIHTKNLSFLKVSQLLRKYNE